VPLTDYHTAVRDAVKGVLDTYAAALATPLTVTTVDDIEGEIPNIAVPGIIVACVGPEQDRPEFSTNAQDGTGYPVLVALLSTGHANGAHSPSAPDLTAFRRAIKSLFHMKRLSGVSQVGYCEVSGDPLVLDREGAAFQRMSSYLTVVAVGRWPRS